MTTLKKLRLYEDYLRSHKERLHNLKPNQPIPDEHSPQNYGLGTREEIAVAAVIRDKVFKP